MINLLTVLFKKEVMDASRDKRSIMAGLYYAIGAPIGMCLLMSVLLQQLASPEALKINIENSERAPGLIAHLNSHDIFASTDVNERKAITLSISEDYQQKMSEGRPATVTLIADKSDDKLRKHINQVERTMAFTALK